MWKARKRGHVASGPWRPRQFSTHCARTGRKGRYCLRWGDLSPIPFLSLASVSVSPAGPACSGSLFSSSARSSAWIERRPPEPKVTGSNPVGHVAASPRTAGKPSCPSSTSLRQPPDPPLPFLGLAVVRPSRRSVELPQVACPPPKDRCLGTATARLGVDGRQTEAKKAGRWAPWRSGRARGWRALNKHRERSSRSAIGGGPRDAH